MAFLWISSYNFFPHRKSATFAAMITEISIDSFYTQHHRLPMIDVRSPGEFEKGHITGATNIPLFSNEERAHVGTVYVQQSKEKAVELGYRYVNPKLDRFIAESRKVAPKSAVAVHCWRGGMRSHAFAEHLHQNGFQEVYVITGGYKAFRNHVLSFFEQPFRLRILGGYTGSGKTFVLKQLKKLGQQVIDLEGIAHHKGSAFGSIGEMEQPTVEQFENSLFEQFRQLNLQNPIWLEDESHNIGHVKIPMPLFRQIRQQVVYFIQIPKEQRARHLVNEYAPFGNDRLAWAINGIAKRLGGQNVQRAHELLRENNFYEVALLALQYYDKAYTRGVEDRNPELVFRIPLADMNHLKNAQSIIKFVEKHEQHQTHTI
ncbi:tRNA 2-selenouridine(34) synthase MnmH [uncultured Sunxiuqinia sp.]|uniref:tRNA 2-selenouridine(34) synthase MnmH n=1 Tax=uncultured Sunxiuqinia sp. TaxID=1573825 RepID=UPI0030D95BFA|tara:strand:+ start:9895 stop:11013 length:1119 start_codon:yes stop_codon:yes gene_type:complete